MSKQLLLMAADLMRRAAEEFSNHGCNDYRLPPLTDEERQELADLHNLANFGTCDPEALKRKDTDDVRTAADFKVWARDDLLMTVFAAALRRMAAEPT